MGLLVSTSVFKAGRYEAVNFKYGGGIPGPLIDDARLQVGAIPDCRDWPIRAIKLGRDLPVNAEVSALYFMSFQMTNRRDYTV